MPQISFQADTQDELIAMVRRWVTGVDAVGVGPAELGERPADRRTRELREVLHRLHEQRDTFDLLDVLL